MIVLDTHVLIWWADGELKKLSRKARQAIELNSKRSELMVSAVSVFEIATLERRGRLRFKIAASEWLAQLRRLLNIKLRHLPETSPSERVNLEKTSLAIRRTE